MDQEALVAQSVLLSVASPKCHVKHAFLNSTLAL